MASTDRPRPASGDTVEAMVRQHLVEQFYFAEAALLDDHRYREWLDLFAEDLHYFVPIHRTRLRAGRTPRFWNFWAGWRASRYETRSSTALCW